MAGRKQHHIPRLYQRGFLVDPAGKSKQVFVFRKGRKSFLSNIDSVAAARDFYSSVPSDDSKTLDDVITDYEGERLTKFVETLRASGPGHSVDPMVAAEVVAHLAPRTSHIRSVFRAGMTEVVDLARDVFTSEHNLAQYIGIDSLSSTESFHEKIVEPIFARGGAANLPSPKALVAEVIYWALRENFETLFAEHNPVFAPLLSMLADRAEDVARGGHIKAMEEGLAPPLRVEDLSKLSWSVESAPSEGAILPDCVAIGYDRSGEPYPYMLIPRDELQIVMLPVSRTAVLVGRNEDAAPLKVESVNQHFAECAHEFFISASDSPEIVRYSTSIGERALTVIKRAMETARAEVLPTPHIAVHPIGRTTGKPDRAEMRQPESLCLSFSVRLFDFGDQSAAVQVSEVLRDIVAAVVLKMPVSRLDGFTFAFDQANALRDLDRGLEQPDKHTGNGGENDFATTPLVVRDGIIKRHIMCPAALAEGLLTEDNEKKRWCVNAIIRLLSAATITEMVDQALPGELLKPVESAYEMTFSHGFGYAHECYFSALAAAEFGDEAAVVEFQRDHFVGTLGEAKAALEDARIKFHQDGDLDRLASIALESASRTLRAAATLHGHCDGRRRPVFDQEGKLEVALNRVKLLDWFGIFREDLEAFWMRAGEWESRQEFLNLYRHVSRFLMQFGIYVWRNEDDTAHFLVAPEGVPTLETLSWFGNQINKG